MEAERKPHNCRSHLVRLLHRITLLSIRRPIPVLSVAGVLALLAIVLTILGLGFHTSRLDLLNPKSSYNKLWLDYIREFGATDDILVVVEGDSPEQIVPVLDEVAEVLSRDERNFRAVLHQVDFSPVRAKGLHYLDVEQLETIERFVTEAKPVVSNGWTRLSVGNMAASMDRRLLAAARDPSGLWRSRAEVEVGHWAASLQQALLPEPRYCRPWPDLVRPSIPVDLDDRHFLVADGQMGVVLLQLAEPPDGDGFARGSEGIDALRRHISGVATRYPEVHIGLTGLPVMENDEMRSSQTAMIEASLLSLFGVACLFVAGFGGIRHPLLTVAALLVSMAWSFGFITIAVGHLNILSVSFAVILIGLGIDFGIHYVARYLQYRQSHISCNSALVRTAIGVGPGIVTGAATTAAAFFTAGFTEFTGIAELGIIAGGGILLCCAGALVMLPSMIHLADRNRDDAVISGPLDVHAWLTPIFRRPVWTLGMSVGVLIFLGLGATWLRYDHNLLNLQPEGLESVRLEHRLIEESDQSVWFALSLARSSEEVLERKAKFEELESVDRVEEIARLLPKDEHLRQPIISRIHSQLSSLPNRVPAIPLQRPEVLDPLLAQLQSELSRTASGRATAERIAWIRARLRQIPEPECFRRLSEYQLRAAQDMLHQLHALAEASIPVPPDFSDLPEGLVRRFFGSDGRHLMKVYGRGNIWDMDAMERFVRDVRSVDPKATGNPLQTFEASRQMKQSYEQAALYSLITIFVLLYFDFRSVRHTLLAMVPVGIGMVLLFGLMGWLGEPLNPANMIVLPLILGIGVDDGVHVVHDYLRRRGGYRMSASTASAVLITSLTTMVGFGSLMIADHRGLQSLGRVLTIGVTCCLFTSLIMLPAALIWRTQRQESEGERTAGADRGEASVPARGEWDPEEPMERAA